MGVTYLLDTHVFVWLLTEPARLSAEVIDTLEGPSVPLMVSAGSALEVATKVRLGKFPAASLLVESWATQVSSIGADGACDHIVPRRDPGRAIAVGSPGPV